MIPIPIIATIIVVLYILSAIKILREYERGVIFRLARLLPHAKGPGITLVFAPVDRARRYESRGENEQAIRYYLLSLKENPRNDFARKKLTERGVRIPAPPKE
ncbi:MAG: hypothetical protein ABR881_27585 [Candidatus Sulfotelmatobacter sp.]|jgi:hypothetical protein